MMILAGTFWIHEFCSQAHKITSPATQIAAVTCMSTRTTVPTLQWTYQKHKVANKTYDAEYKGGQCRIFHILWLSCIAALRTFLRTPMPICTLNNTANDNIWLCTLEYFAITKFRVVLSAGFVCKSGPPVRTTAWWLNSQYYIRI